MSRSLAFDFAIAKRPKSEKPRLKKRDGLSRQGSNEVPIKDGETNNPKWDRLVVFDFQDPEMGTSYRETAL
jgi:hypothetical protein